MPWNDASELLVAGSGQVYVAPVGTALPATHNAALNAAFTGLGYHTEEGVSLSVTPDIAEVPAWQSRQPIRRDLVGQDIAVSFELQQWNENNVVLAFGGGEISSVSGGYRYDFPEDGDALEERAAVVDCVDGDVTVRFVWRRVTVMEGVETSFQRGEPAVLPITLGVLAPEEGGNPGYFLTNSTAFATGS